MKKKNASLTNSIRDAMEKKNPPTVGINPVFVELRRAYPSVPRAKLRKLLKKIEKRQKKGVK